MVSEGISEKWKNEDNHLRDNPSPKSQIYKPSAKYLEYVSLKTSSENEDTNEKKKRPSLLTVDQNKKQKNEKHLTEQLEERKSCEKESFLSR